MREKEGKRVGDGDGGGRERLERQRETERDRERETDRQTDRDRDLQKLAKTIGGGCKLSLEFSMDKKQALFTVASMISMFLPITGIRDENVEVV